MPRSFSGPDKPRLGFRRISRNGELGSTDCLAEKKVAHGFHRLELGIEVRLEVELHRGRPAASVFFCFASITVLPRPFVSVPPVEAEYRPE